jgi:hypothetical protein
MRNRETGLLSAHVLQCWGAICSALPVFLALFVLAAEAQPPLRKYPFAQVGLVLPNYWEAPTDPATVNYFMSRHGSATANTVKRWETEHDGATGRLLRDAPSCYITETADEVVQALERLWHNYIRGEALFADRTQFLEPLRYPNLAEQLASLVKDVVQRG